MNKVIIRNGTIIDGSGRAPFVADLTYSDGIITAIGKDLDDSAHREIDATDLIVSPGFIDTHTHMDGQLFWDKEASSSAWHGCTTVITGNCGYSLAPLKDGDASYPLSLMTGVEQIPRKTLEAGVPWDWTTFGEYTKSLERSGLAVNASTYVGLPVVRHSVMGADAFEGVASEAQLDAMRTALHTALDEGALGISMNRLPIDRDDMGRTAAGLNCDWSELRSMAEVLREHPGTMVQCVPAFILPFEGFTDKDKVEQQEWIEVARAAARPMVWSPLIEIWKDAHLEYLRAAKASGVQMWGCSNAVPICVNSTFETENLFGTIPGLERIFAVGVNERIEMFKRPSFREEARKILGTEQFSAYPNRTIDEAGNTILGTPFAYRWADMWRLPPPPAAFTLSGPSVLQESRASGKHPVDVILDGAVESGLKEFLTIFPFGYSGELLASVINDPHVVLGANDTGAHIKFLSCAGSTQLLGDLVRRTGSIGLTEGVHMLTGRLAKVFGLTDRGVLRPGLASDIVIFDAAKIDSFTPYVTHDLPNGDHRFVQRATGIHSVIVNGRTIQDQGKATGELPGRYLRPSEMAARSAAA
jgi:N-acyl-D-aspartate/D-glutamate deacylase